MPQSVLCAGRLYVLHRQARLPSTGLQLPSTNLQVRLKQVKLKRALLLLLDQGW